MRGNPPLNPTHTGFEGSIPAYAGEPAGMTPAICMAGVYPRVCGGTPPLRLPCQGLPGLSPRMRGNLPRTTLNTVSLRSIPAYAGEP